MLVAGSMQGYHPGLVNPSYGAPVNPWQAQGYPPTYWAPHPVMHNNNLPFPTTRPQNPGFVPPSLTRANSAQVRPMATPMPRPRYLSDDRSTSRSPQAKPQKPVKPARSALKRPTQHGQPVIPGSLGDGIRMLRTRTMSDPVRVRGDSFTRPISREASRRGRAPGETLGTTLLSSHISKTRVAP